MSAGALSAEDSSHQPPNNASLAGRRASLSVQMERHVAAAAGRFQTQTHDEQLRDQLTRQAAHCNSLTALSSHFLAIHRLPPGHQAGPIAAHARQLAQSFHLYPKEDGADEALQLACTRLLDRVKNIPAADLEDADVQDLMRSLVELTEAFAGSGPWCEAEAPALWQALAEIAAIHEKRMPPSVTTKLGEKASSLPPDPRTQARQTGPTHHEKTVQTITVAAKNLVERIDRYEGGVNGKPIPLKRACAVLIGQLKQMPATDLDDPVMEDMLTWVLHATSEFARKSDWCRAKSDDLWVDLADVITNHHGAATADLDVVEDRMYRLADACRGDPVGDLWSDTLHIALQHPAQRAVPIADCAWRLAESFDAFPTEGGADKTLHAACARLSDLLAQMPQLDGSSPQVRKLMQNFLHLTSAYTRKSDWCGQQSPPLWDRLIFDVLDKHRMVDQPGVVDELLDSLLRPGRSTTELRIANEVPRLVSGLDRSDVSADQAAAALNVFAQRMLSMGPELMQMEPPGTGHQSLIKAIGGIEEARTKHNITDSTLEAHLGRLRTLRDLAAPLNPPIRARAGGPNQV